MKANSLEEIYQMYYKDCYLYALYFTKNIPYAEDLVSQAYLSIYESLPFLQKEQIKYYLFKTIKHRFIDIQRKEKRHQLWRRTVFPQYKQEISSTPLDEIIQEEERLTLYRSIDRLPEDTREVILLYYFMDLSIDEIAQYKAWTYTQTKNRLYRGRQLLKEELIHEENL